MDSLNSCQFPETRPSLNCSSTALEDAGAAGVIIQRIVIASFVFATIYFFVELLRYQTLLRRFDRGYCVGCLRVDWRAATIILAVLFSFFCILGAVFGAYFVPDTFALTAFFFCSAGGLGAAANYVGCLTVYQVEPNLKSYREKSILRISALVMSTCAFLIYGPFLTGLLVALDRMNFRDLTITSSAINVVLSSIIYYMSQRYAFKVVKTLEEHIIHMKQTTQLSLRSEDQLGFAEATKEKMLKWVNGLKSITITTCLISLVLVVPKVAERAEVFVFYAFYIIVTFLAVPLNLATLLSKIKYQPMATLTGELSTVGRSSTRNRATRIRDISL